MKERSFNRGEELICRELAIQKKNGTCSWGSRKKESSFCAIPRYIPRRYIPSCRRNPSPGQRPPFCWHFCVDSLVVWFGLNGWKFQSGAAEVRFAYRFTNATYSVTRLVPRCALNTLKNIMPYRIYHTWPSMESCVMQGVFSIHSREYRIQHHHYADMSTKTECGKSRNARDLLICSGEGEEAPRGIVNKAFGAQKSVSFGPQYHSALGMTNKNTT